MQRGQTIILFVQIVYKKKIVLMRFELTIFHCTIAHVLPCGGSTGVSVQPYSGSKHSVTNLVQLTMCITLKV